MSEQQVNDVNASGTDVSSSHCHRKTGPDNEQRKKGNSYGLFTLNGNGTGKGTWKWTLVPFPVSDQCEHFCLLSIPFPGPVPVQFPRGARSAFAVDDYRVFLR